MIAMKLTGIRFAVMQSAMTRRWTMTMLGSALLSVLGLACSGCVSVTAPDKPIEINLNINIRQEVVYRLASDARETIEENAEIF